MASAHASTRRAALITSALWALAASAAAQAEPAPAGTPAAAPPPAATSEELPPPPPPPPPPTYAAPSGEGSCTPACRSGFMCQGGQCVSACNPPCSSGEQCTAQGECVASGSYGGAPSFPEPEPMDDTRPRDGVEQHDGFMLRFTLGGGGAGAGLDGDGLDLAFSGGGGAFSFDIGGSPTDNLVIHLRISDFVMISPKVTLEGGPIGVSSELDGSLTSNFFGVGLTYYFMPVNLYLTAALGMGWLSIDYDGDNNDGRATDAGLGFDFDVGKEWWVSDNWGLGIAGRFSLVRGTTTDDDTDAEADYAMAAFALLFSATYQ